MYGARTMKRNRLNASWTSDRREWKLPGSSGTHTRILYAELKSEPRTGGNSKMLSLNEWTSETNRLSTGESPQNIDVLSLSLSIPLYFSCVTQNGLSFSGGDCGNRRRTYGTDPYMNIKAMYAILRMSRQHTDIKWNRNSPAGRHTLPTQEYR